MGFGMDFDTAAYLAGVEAQVQDFRETSCQDLIALGSQVAESARQKAPVLAEPRQGRQPGDLARAIGSTGLMTGPQGWYVEVGVNVGDAEGHVDYGFYEEFGSVHNPPRPFLRPAMAEAGQLRSNLLTSGRHRAARARRIEKRAAQQIGLALMGKVRARELARQKRAGIAVGRALRSVGG